jgi:Plavaka transposase
VAIDMVATDENITLELELEHEVPPPNDTSQNPSHSQPSLAVEPDPEINAAGRAVRKKRLTWKLLQQLPAPPSPLPETLTAFEGIEPISETLPPSSEVVWRAIKTTRNSFGLYREYPNIPTHNPDNTLCLLNLVDNSPPINEMELSASVSTPLSLQDSISNSSSSNAASESFFPFKNSTIFGMMSWMWTGSSMKSIGEMKKLVDFLKSNDFKKDDLATFDIHSETTKFDNYLERPASDNPQNGWRESEVIIQVPDGKIHSKDSIPTFKVPGFHHRSLVNVIKTAYSDLASTSFHYMPFKSFWKDSSTPESVPQRVYDELYSSDAMIEAHMKLQQQPPELECALERVIASLMLWSDSTHLANFGTASLWPLYLFFGNQSKWVRGKPKTASCHHVAYIPKVSIGYSI